MWILTCMLRGVVAMWLCIIRAQGMIGVLVCEGPICFSMMAHVLSIYEF